MLASCINQGVKSFIHNSNFFLWISLVVEPKIIANFCIALYEEYVLVFVPCSGREIALKKQKIKTSHGRKDRARNIFTH